MLIILGIIGMMAGEHSTPKIDKTLCGTWMNTIKGTPDGDVNMYLLLMDSGSWNIASCGKKLCRGDWSSVDGGISVNEYGKSNKSTYRLSSDGNGKATLTSDGGIVFTKISDDHLALWKVGENQYIDPNGPFADPSW